MRISDWSSDVCSSDLQMGIGRAVEIGFDAAQRVADPGMGHGGIPTEPDCGLQEYLSRPVPPRPGRGGMARPSVTEEGRQPERSEEHTSELQSLMRISYAVFCLKKKKNKL